MPLINAVIIVMPRPDDDGETYFLTRISFREG